MSSLFFAFTLILSYSFIGAGIKLLDQAADHPNGFQSHQTLLWLVTVTLVVLVNLWVYYDLFTAALAIGIIMGLVVTRKVNNNYFFVLTFAILPLSIFRIIDFVNLFFILQTIIIIFLASIIDELLHSTASKIQSPLFRWIIARRPLLKIVVLILPFFGLLTFIHTIAFWGFDFAYDFVTHYFRAARLSIK